MCSSVVFITPPTVCLYPSFYQVSNLHLIFHHAVLCIPPPLLLFLLILFIPSHCSLKTANPFIFLSLSLLFLSQVSLTSIFSLFCRPVPFEVDLSVCLCLCRGGGGRGVRGVALTRPPSLVISLRWLSEHTAITKAGTPLLRPALVCVCMSVCVQYGMCLCV